MTLTSTSIGSFAGVTPITLVKIEVKILIGPTLSPTATFCSSVNDKTFAIKSNTSSDLSKQISILKKIKLKDNTN